RLARDVTTAPDRTSFTLRLREGVTWHDGSPFGAADVLFTLRTLVSPDQPFPSELGQHLDVAGATVIDQHTLRVPVKHPVGDPATMFATAETFIVKDGTKKFDAADIVGTGPFRMVSAEAGRSSTVRRYDRHWDGAPHLDEIVFLSLADPQARFNAMTGGQADFAAAISYAAAKTVRHGTGIEVRTAGDRERTGFGMVLNTQIPPFNDPRARRAVRLAVDRKQLVDSIFLGYGVVGNDLYGAGAQYFDNHDPVPRDVAQAKSLLAQAGAGTAPIVVRSAETEAGVNASVQLFAEQMKSVGLTVQPKIVALAEMQDLKAMAQANAVAFSIGAFPLQTIYSQMQLLPSLAFADAPATAAMTAAAETSDASQRAAAWRTVQQAYFDHGNLLVWGFGDTLSLARTNLRGVEPRGAAKYPYLGKAWLA
ncbi:MAG: peptide/nickel transport system substrate-binding protein, partial [Micromonosporaceae bacterium]|nr:peptide/nickel transport system substrate-binding protein [Micromonosporaceae bacterium]